METSHIIVQSGIYLYSPAPRAMANIVKGANTTLGSLTKIQFLRRQLQVSKIKEEISVDLHCASWIMGLQ